MLSRRTLLAAALAGATGLAAKARAELRKMKITRVRYFESPDSRPIFNQSFHVVVVETDAGITGIGEGGSPDMIAQCAGLLIGQDPARIDHLWQYMYRGYFYPAGREKLHGLGALDMALWDIKGKALGVPVYELLGGPTRDRVRVYAHARTIDAVKQQKAQGFTAFKTGPYLSRRGPSGRGWSRYVETPDFVKKSADNFAELRAVVGDDCDIGIDFHGAISPATAKLLIKAIEPYSPMFVEEPVNCQYLDAMVDIARGTHLPIATGERIFTKWGFREILEKQAAVILQPDLCHAGGITECRLIAGMAEAHYASIAPHNPLGPISLAAGVQLAAAIPNFTCQEQVSLGEGYLKTPFVVKNGYVDLPRGPGLGIELDKEQMKDKIGHDWRNPETYDEEDGSVVDW